MMQTLASMTHKQWITLETADDVACAVRDIIKLVARKTTNEIIRIYKDAPIMSNRNNQ